MRQLWPGLFVGLLLAAIAITWDYYSERRSLEVRIVSAISLLELEADPILGDLSISYKGKVIDNLTKMQFAVINTGRTPISDEEVKEFPTIDFGPKTEILHAEILREDPPNLHCRISFAASASKATFRFALLNPKDLVEFSLYVTGLIQQSPLVNARIKGIKKIKVVDKTAEEVEASRRIGWSFYVVSLLTFVLLATFAVGLGQYQHR